MAEHALTSGLTFLKQALQKNGSFLSLSSDNPKDFSQALTFHSLFSTALVLECLSQINSATTLSQKIANFLLTQKSEHWTFNYWDRNSTEFRDFPYPDDLDDTFCSLSALYHYDQKIISGEALAAVVNVLTTLEVSEGGPYRTWLVPESADQKWQDVDLVVNANIAYFLSLQQVNLSNVTNFIDEKIINNQLTSPYYPELIPIIYFVSRNYQGKHAPLLAEKLLALQLKKGFWSTPLYTALATLALINLRQSLTHAQHSLNFLLETQNSDGSWPVASFYTGVNPEYDRKYYAGSAALSTAFCLQAITHLEKTVASGSAEQKDDVDIFYKSVNQRINKKITVLPTDLRVATTAALETTLQEKNRRQVALLPYYFKEALGARGKEISNEFLIQLSETNLYGWVAYTIYDNFLDDEGAPALLPTANFFLRELTHLFIQLLPGTEFSSFFHSVMNQLENANTWEIQTCRVKIKDQKLQLKKFRLPDYGDLHHLADRSLGHALSPLAILTSLGFQPNDSEFEHIFTFFKHYLIVRQLNDDAHDWEQDLKLGHVNVVGAKVLARAALKKDIEIKEISSKLQPLFWDSVIVEVCDLIFDHIKQAETALKRSSLLDNPTLLLQLLKKYQLAAESALSEQQNAVSFLKNYR